MKTKLLFSLALVICLSLGAGVVLASGLTTELQTSHGQFGGSEGLDAPSGTLTSMVGKIIKGILSLLGIVAVLLILYAGYLWMTAGGNEEDVKKAKAWIVNAIIGIIIIVLAYAITSFVIDKISGAASGGGGGWQPPVCSPACVAGNTCVDGVCIPTKLP